MKLGSHVSNRGDLMLVGSVEEALSYGANAFMIYLGAPQNSYRKPVKALNIPKMKELLNENKIAIEDVIIHAPYIVNLAQSDDVKRQYAIDFITNEVLLTAEVGAKYLVLHPGAHMNKGIDVGLDLIIASLKEILKRTSHTYVSIALETMAGKGTECGYEFEHLKRIISTIDNPRLSVCFDTCHTNDAGYDLVNDYEGVIETFDEIIGLDRIAVFHINDSKNIRGARKDRHENIGFGEIGFDTLMKFIYDERFKDIPKILETPYVKSDKKEYAPYKWEIEMIKNKKFDPDLIKKIKEG